MSYLAAQCRRVATSANYTFRPTPPFGENSDAQGLGHIACRALLSRATTCRAHIPDRSAHLANEAEGESDIYLCEICAAILTSCVTSDLGHNSSRPCVIFIDNQVAMDAIVEGSTSSELCAVLVGVFWGFAARCPIH